MPEALREDDRDDCAGGAVVALAVSDDLGPTDSFSTETVVSSSCSELPSEDVSAAGDRVTPAFGDDSFLGGAGGGVAHTGGSCPAFTCFTEPGSACCLLIPFAAREKNPVEPPEVADPAECAFSFFLANLWSALRKGFDDACGETFVDSSDAP